MALAYAVATVSGLAERSDAAPESCCGIFNLIHGNKMGTVLAVLVTETKPKGIKKPRINATAIAPQGFHTKRWK